MWEQQNEQVLCCSDLELLCLNKESAENTPSAKVASQECERDFKVSFYRFFFHSTGFSGNLGGWVSARKTSEVCCLYTPDMSVKIFSVHIQQLSSTRSIGEGTEC